MFDHWKILIIGITFFPAWIGAIPITPTVPNQINFCGIELELTESARVEIQKTVDKLCVRPEYLEELVKRSDTWMPYVEAVFQQAGVPEDLKYLVLQESALKGDAVSSSNAVGFWQFKEFTAREMGLKISSSIDERKHIYYSSYAAAKYFYENNKIFDNYLYAIVAYYTGGGGSLGYIRPELFGKTKMTIDASFHWYALKAIAHKVVFESLLGKNVIPEVWLNMVEISGGESLQAIVNRFNISESTFRQYNLWIMGNTLPPGRNYWCFIPGEQIRQGVQGNLILAGEIPQLMPTPAPLEVLDLSDQPIVSGKTKQSKKITSLPMNWDEEFQKEYIIMDKTLPLITAINSIQVDLKDFIRWNSISDPQYILEANAWYRKSTPELADIHIVKAGENWNRISDLYQISIRDLLKLNREKPKSKLIPGRKIYLSRKRKKTENPIILTPVLQAIPSAKVSSITWKSPIELTPEERKVPVLCRPVSGQLKCKVEIAEEKPKFPELKSHWITHEVKTGEELWMLAKKYDTRGDLIQKINQLSTSRIKSGMKLKIFQVIAGRN